MNTHPTGTPVGGRGPYVAGGGPPALADMNHGEAVLSVSPAELMAARVVLEPALVDMVIGNATAADFARMDECNHRAEGATTLEDFEQWDAALHEAVAAAAHNSFISSVFQLMSAARSQGE